MPVSLGMPSAPPPVLAPRRATRQIRVGSVGVGSQHQVSVQSMTTTKTHDIGATLQQIAELTAAGCDIVRVACPKTVDADALPAIAAKSPIPVIADIHFQPKYIFAAIDAGCAAVRVNPGNIKEFDGRVKEVAQAAGDAGIPIRIGVNGGSLDPRLLEKYGKATPEALVESALWEASLFEEHRIALLWANYGRQQLKQLRDAGADVGYVIPREGALAWLDCWAISRGARNVALAEAWIDFALEPPMSRALVERQGLSNTLEEPENLEGADRLIWLRPVEDAERRARLWERILSGERPPLEETP